MNDTSQSAVTAAPPENGPADRRPTICQLLHGMSVGGAEILADRLARGLGSRFRFVFACLDELGELGHSLQDAGYCVEHLQRKPGVDIRCSWRLLRFLRKQNVQVVLAHQYTPFFYAISTRLLGGSIPVLFTEHGRWFPDYPRRKRIIFNRLMLRRRDRVVAVGEAVRQALIDNEGLAAERVQVIYNGIPLDRFEQADFGLRDAARSELGLGNDQFVITQVARLDHLKDHATAVRTAAQLNRREVKFRLLVVGDGPERGRLEQEIADHGVADVVRLLGQRNDVERILQAADACLLTSISEGIPLTLIEGMAAGLPIVSTDVGGVGEIVEEGETGFLVPSGDDGLLADRLIQLASNSELAASLGDCGRRRAHEKFSEESMHGHYAQLFDEMIQRRSARRAPNVASPSN